MPDNSDRKLIQNRIIGHGDEPVDEILFNPANWRIHPKVQQDALQGVLEEVGWVQDVVINKTTGHLIDGHLRCQLAGRNGEKTVPAVYVELTAEEEGIVLASFDTITIMAGTDKEKLNSLLNSAEESGSEAIAAMLASVREQFKLGGANSSETDGKLVDKFNLSIADPKTVVAPKQIFRLQRHVLVCASPVHDVSVWLNHLKPLDIFVPYCSPSTFFATIDADRKIVGVNSSEYICGHIIDRYKDIYGEASVRQEN